jgi:hypothetical protein
MAPPEPTAPPPAGAAVDIAQLARQLAPYLADMLRAPGHEAAPAAELAEMAPESRCPICLERECVHQSAMEHEHVQVESYEATPVAAEHARGHDHTGDGEYEAELARPDQGFDVAELVGELQRAQAALRELFPADELLGAQAALPEDFTEDFTSEAPASGRFEWERN